MHPKLWCTLLFLRLSFILNWQESSSKRKKSFGSRATDDRTGHQTSAVICACACVRVFVLVPSCENLCTLYYLIFFKYPFEWALSRHATRFFSHALCTVPLHIFIYYCVFQDQNECQIGSGESQLDITADVGVSRGCEMGGVSLSGRNGSQQDGFCSCFVPDSPGHPMRKRYGINKIFPNSTISCAPLSLPYRWSFWILFYRNCGLWKYQQG